MQNQVLVPRIHVSAHASTLIKPGHIRVSDVDPVSTLVAMYNYLYPTEAICTSIEFKSDITLWSSKICDLTYLIISIDFGCAYPSKLPLIVQQQNSWLLIILIII